MPTGLRRYQQSGDLHFVTCHRRLAYLGSATARGLFERSLEVIRRRYRFFVTGYVVMPEHVHLLVSEPFDGTGEGIAGPQTIGCGAEPGEAVLAAPVL